MNFDYELVKKILKLKKEKNAIILAHCYQNIEIDEVADYIGDSLYLSQMAAKTNAQIIVFAGVYFMAETAKILSPEKKVLLPSLKSGCLMADMINIDQLRDFKSKYNNVPVVCYINSTAQVKSESYICCTSSNAVNVVKSLNTKDILFVPDTYLGNYVKNQLNNNVNIITYPGYCPTHLRITPKDVLKMKEKYNDAIVLAHPECHSEVLKLADYIGSTKGIMNEAGKSKNKTFIIATEIGVVDRLKRDLPDKEFILVSNKAICPNMKHHHLEDIYNALLYEQHEIVVDENIIEKAIKPIQRMIAIN